MSDHFGNIPIELPKPSPSGKDEKPASPPAPARTPKEKGRPKKGRPQTKTNRAWFWILGIALVIGLYAAAGFVGVPYYVGKSLPVSFQETTGMVLDPGKTSFNPFTFRFVTKDAKILTEAGPALLSLKSLTADLAPLSLLRRDLVSNAINVEELDLNITREQDGSYNFDQLVRRQKTGNASEIMDFSDLPFFFSLNNIAIRNSRILFNDLPANKTHTIADMQLDLPAFSNIPFRADKYIHPRFSAVINGSPVELTGQAHLGEPGGPDLITNLSCDLHGLDLPAYSEYLPVDLPLVFKKGKADGRLDFHFNPEAKEEDKISVGFDLQIVDTELQTPDESILVTSSMTQLSGKLQPVAKTLHFTTISFTEPAVHSYGETFLKNINGLIKREKGASAKDEAAASPFVVATDSLEFENGTFHHYRKQQGEKPEFSWKSLQLQVKDYSSVAKGEEGKDFGSFNLSGEKEGAATTFSWQGVFTSPENLKGTLKFAKMEFPELMQSLGAEKELQVQGSADLKGELAFPFATDSATKVGYKLTDAELAVQNFKLLEDKQTVLSSPLLQATGLSTAGSAVDWGNIAMQNGVAVFSANQTPSFFKHFNSDKNRVQGLDLEGQVTFMLDKKGKTKILFNNISLKAGNLVTPEKAKNNFSLTAQTSTGATLSSQGDMRLAPFALAAKTEFSGLAAEEVFPLFTESELLNSVRGSLAGNGILSFPQQSFAGDLRIAKGQVQKAGKPLYSWEDSVFQGVNYTSRPFHLGIALAAIDQPEYTWQIGLKDDDPMQQVASFFQQHLPTVEQQSGDKNKINISPVDIQEIRIVNGQIRIQDNRMKPKWQGQVTDFSGSIKEIHQSAATNGSDFSFTGKLDEVPLSVEGSLNAFAKTEHGRFRMTLDGYSLASFNKQLAAKTDIDTREGEFTLTLEAMWQNGQDGQYRNRGSLVFAGAKPVSEKADSALPLALLTGPEDTLQFDFDLLRNAPVGKTTLAEEIISTWETMTVKAAVSPLLLASGDFSDLIGNEFAEFLPGEEMLSDKGQETLIRYSDLLTSHPYLGLTLSGGVDKQQDGEAIKEQLAAIEQQRVNTLNQKRFEEWQKRKEAYEQKLQEPPKTGPDGKIVEVTIPPDILAGFTPIQPDPVVVKDAMLLELAQKRLETVHQYLNSQLTLEEHRITLTPPKRLTDTENSVIGVKVGLKAIKR